MEYNPGEEKVQIVDINNNPTGGALRKVMRKENLIHRSSYVFLYSSKKQLYVQKRSSLKDYLPGYYTLCTGGVVQENESDLENATREVQEEMGIEKPMLEFVQKHYYEDSNVRAWGNVYLCKYDGEIKCQKEEVDWVEMWGMNEVEEKVTKGVMVTPDSLVVFRIIYDKLKMKA